MCLSEAIEWCLASQTAAAGDDRIEHSEALQRPPARPVPQIASSFRCVQFALNDLSISYAIFSVKHQLHEGPTSRSSGCLRMIFCSFRMGRPV